MIITSNNNNNFLQQSNLSALRSSTMASIPIDLDYKKKISHFNLW